MEQIHVTNKFEITSATIQPPGMPGRKVIDLKFVTLHPEAGKPSATWPTLRMPEDLARQLLRALSEVLGSQPPSRALN